MAVLPKIFEGLQAVRSNSYKISVLSGISSSLGVNARGQSSAYLAVRSSISLDIRTVGMRGVLARKQLPNEAPIPTGLQDGVYNLFMASNSEPNQDGIIVGDNSNVFLYLSPVFGGFGSRNSIRNITMELDRPKYIRPHPTAFYIHKGKIYPTMSLGEGHGAWQRFVFEDWQPFKSAMIDGVYLVGSALKYDHSKRKPIDVLEAGKHYVSFRDAMPETHKWLECQIEWEGEGDIYLSNNAYRGRRIASANGKGVRSVKFMPRSESSGNAIKITIDGTARVTKFYALASQSQQPM